MEKQLKLIMLLSLKEMALRRVAVLLWSGSDVLASILKVRVYRYYTGEGQKEWRELFEDKIEEKISKLELPKSLVKQMIDIVRPIGFEIRRWAHMLQRFGLVSVSALEEIGLPDLPKLCWTATGTINYRKTAEKLVRCDALDVEARYKLACINCFEDDIPLLWEKLPEWWKDFYRGVKGNYSWAFLTFCWPHILTGELSKLDYLLRARDLTTFNQWAFEHSVKEGNKTAAEYFFQKLMHEEREVSLVRAAHSALAVPNWEDFKEVKFSEVMCFLLTLMTPEQQMEVVKAHPIHVLLCFLDWPRIDLFSQNAGLFWDLLPPSGYGDLLDQMAKIFQYLYFSKWFQEFFMHSPLDLKKYFVDEKSKFGITHAYRFLLRFLMHEDSKSIEAMFRNVDAADRVKIVFNRRVLKLFYISIGWDKWHMVELCLREATLSKEDMKRLKTVFMEFLKSSDTGDIEWENQKWKGFFDFFHETDASADKRKKAQKRKLENCCPE